MLRRHLIWATTVLTLAATPLPAEAADGQRDVGRRLSGVPTARTIEVEAMAATAQVSGGTVLTQPMDGFGDDWSGGAQLLWRGGGPGSTLTLPFGIATSGTYVVEVLVTQAPDFGDIVVDCDGRATGATFSAFAPRVAVPRAVLVGRVTLQEGAHTLHVRITGRDRASLGYLVGLDAIRLTPVELPGSDDAPAAAGSARIATAAQAAVRAGRGVPGPVTQAEANGPGPDCDSTCSGDSSNVFRTTAAGACKIWFRVTCHPYGCDDASGICRATCASDADCAQGGTCNTTSGLCAVAPALCVDAFAIRLPNGQVQSCMPYKCVAGGCDHVCDSSADCAPGYGCNAATGVCVKGGK